MNVSSMSEQELYYACKAYCEPIKLVWMAILLFVGVPFNICVIYTLLKCPQLRESFVSIYLAIITGIRILVFVSIVLVFFFDKQYRAVHNDDLLDDIKILISLCFVLTTSTHWMIVVLSFLRVYRIIYPKSWLRLYSHITSVCTCTTIIVCYVLWYVELVLPELDISKRKTVAIIFHVYSDNGRLELALVMFMIPSVFDSVLNIMLVVFFKYRLVRACIINDPDLYARIVGNMTRFAVLKTLQWLLLLMPFSMVLIFLQEFSDNVPTESQQIPIGFLTFSFVTDSLINSLKYRVVWGLFRMQLDNNLSSMYGFVRRHQKKVSQKVVDETNEKRERMIRMLFRKNNKDILSSTRSALSTALSTGTLYGSEFYDPVLDMFMNRSRRRGATVTHAFTEEGKRFSLDHKKHRLVVVKIATERLSFAENEHLVVPRAAGVKTGSGGSNGTRV